MRTCGASAKVLRNPSANENIYAGLALEHHLRPLGPSARSRRNSNANENNLVQRSANEHVLAQRAPSNICGHVGHQQRFSRETQTRHVGPALGFLRTYGPSVKVLHHPSANKHILVQRGPSNMCGHVGHQQRFCATQARMAISWHSVARTTFADMWAISKGSAQPKRERKYFGTAWPVQHMRICGQSAQVLRNLNANANMLTQPAPCKMYGHVGHRLGLAVGEVAPQASREQARFTR